jgi:RNA polymerase sigma-70 factor (ECF subfamily)
MTHEELADAYRRYGHLVLRRCQRILRGRAGADDALQEVFVRLWRYGESYRQADSPLLWLYRVADRCCFDQLARHGTRGEVPLDEASEVALSGGGHGQALEDRDVVLRFLDRFDDRVKQVAVLHYLDEWTQDEIAAATGWSRQTVWKKLTYLRERAASLRASYYGEVERT